MNQRNNFRNTFVQKAEISFLSAKFVTPKPNNMKISKQIKYFCFDKDEAMKHPSVFKCISKPQEIQIEYSGFNLTNRNFNFFSPI